MNQIRQYIKRIAALFFAACCFTAKAQLMTVSSDPEAEASLATQVGIQSETLENIIEALKTAKDAYQTYVQVEQEINMIKQQVQTDEARLHDLSQMSSLNYNDIMRILNSTSCLMGNNYYYLNTNYMSAVNMLLRGVVSCNNDELYLTTFSGMKKKMVDNNMWNSPVLYSGNPSQDVFNVQQNYQAFTTQKTKAANVNDASQNAFQANTLDASVKMKALAGSLDSLGTQFINKSRDSDGNLSEYERLSLYAKGLELHVDATETINKAYQMEKTATDLSNTDADVFAAVKRKKLADECAVFRK